MNEEQRVEADAKIQELQYANKKLAAELGSAHESARVASERNRRGLRALRDGLASVEDAVSLRATQGRELIATTCQSLAKLKQCLFDQTLPPGLEIQTTLTLGEVMKSLEQLEDILVSGVGKEISFESKGGDRPRSRSNNPHQDLQKAELEAEITHLKSQAEVLKVSAEQASTAAAAAAEAASAAATAVDKAGQQQQQQQVAMDAVLAVDVAADIARMGMELQHAKHECEILRGQVAELQERLALSEKSSLMLRSFIDEVRSSGMQSEQRSSELERQLVTAHHHKDALEREVASLHHQLSDQRQAAEEAGRKLAALQGTLSSQNEDMRNAFMLISESHKEATRAAKSHPTLTNLPASLPTFPLATITAPRIQMPFVHLPPPASFSSQPQPSSSIPQPPPPPPMSLHQPSQPLTSSTFHHRNLAAAHQPAAPSQHNVTDASRDAAATALLAARVAAAAVNSSSTTRPIPSYAPQPLRELTKTTLPSTSSSQGPNHYSLTVPLVDQRFKEVSSDEDTETRLRNQMKDMKELDSEILELEEMLKKAASGFL